MSRVPSYKIVYRAIKQRIKERRYETGSLLPTETELEGEFGVSRTTIRRATAMLASEGYIRVVQGRGSEVLDAFTAQSLNSLSSITETLTAKGFRVSTQGMCIDRVPAPRKVAAALGIPEGKAVYLIQRVQCADGTPIAIMNNYIKESVAPGIEQYAGKFVSLYQFLEDRYLVVFKDAWEDLSASAAEFMEAQVLHVPVGAPLLLSRRISNSEQGPIEYSVTKLVADRYEYSVYLSGR